MKPANPLLSIALLLAPCLAATAANDPIELPAPLTGVTVFPEGALIEHRVQLQLPAGRSRVTMVLEDRLEEGEGEAPADRYRFATSGCQLIESSVQTVRIPTSNALIENHQRALAEQSRQVHSAQTMVESAQSDLEMLEAMARTMAEQVDVSDRDSMNTVYEFLAERRRLNTDALVQAEHRLAEANEALRELEEQATRLQRGNTRLQAMLLVESKASGMVQLLATSFLEAAGWTPQLRITRSNATELAEVTVLANVTNDTSRDWQEIALTLSSDQRRDFQPLDGVQIAPIDEQRGDEVPQPLETPAIDAFAGHSLRATHPLPNPTTIHSKQRKAVLLERFETPCQVRHQARPTVDPHCHVQTMLRNETAQLMRRAPVSLFLDGQMIGRTTIEDVAPGDPFLISWGIRPNLEIDRTLVEQRSIRTGLLGGGRLTTLRYQTTIRNLEPEPLEVILEDRLPTPLSDKIKVSAIEFSQLPDVAPEQADGRIIWTVQVPAGGTDAPPTTLEWTIEVTHSADLRTTPIPQ